MKLETVEIKNFRGLTDFRIDPAGQSLFVVSENGVGKTTIMAAVSKALGRDQSIARRDFSSADEPIEIAVTLSGFTPADAANFPEVLSFSGPPTLRIGLRATWDHSEGEAEVVHGFPDKAWRRATRQQRESLPLLWLPAHRDAARVLHLVGRKTILAQLLDGVDLAAALSGAGDEIAVALDKLAGAKELADLLEAAAKDLAALVPGVVPHAFFLKPLASDPRDLLEQFQLAVTHSGASLPVSQHSAGLGQLGVFVFAARLLAKQPKAIVLVDEPEISLHPQAQRALVSSFQALPNQFLIATHSSSVLDQADLRRVIRLHRGPSGVRNAQATTLTEAEARRLARFFNTQTAEACFARKVVFVEGPSDRVGLMLLAQRLGKTIDARGTTILSLDGGGTIGAYLKLFGPKGLDLELSGLCDLDKAELWRTELNNVGITVSNQAEMAAKGFLVADPDLEGVLVAALGVAEIETLIAAEGEAAKYTKFKNQPANKTATPEAILRAFLHKDNIRWSALLVERIDTTKLPGVLHDIAHRL